METVLAALGVSFCGYLAVAMAYFTWRSFERGQTSVSSGTLVWIPQALRHLRHHACWRCSSWPLFPGALGLPLEDLSMRAGEVAE